jgi:hypothetical protein
LNGHASNQNEKNPAIPVINHLERVMGGVEAQATEELEIIQVGQPAEEVRIQNMVEVLVTIRINADGSKMTLILSERQPVRVVAAGGNTRWSKHRSKPYLFQLFSVCDIQLIRYLVHHHVTSTELNISQE